MRSGCRPERTEGCLNFAGAKHAIGGRDSLREATRSQKQNHDTQDRPAVRDAGNNCQTIHLSGRHRSACGRMDRHGDNAPNRAGDERDARFAVISHAATVAIERESGMWIFAESSRYPTNRWGVSRNEDREEQKRKRSTG